MNKTRVKNEKKYILKKKGNCVISGLFNHIKII